MNERNYSSKIEIPLRQSSNLFDKNTYNENLLLGLINKVDFEAILDTASQLINNAIKKKKKNDEIKLPKHISYLTAIAIVLSISYTFFLVFASFVDSEISNIFIWIAIVCLIFAASITFGLAIYNFLRKLNDFKPLTSFIKEDLDSFLELTNVNNIKNNISFSFNSNKRIITLFIYKQIEINQDSTERRSLIENDDDKNKDKDKDNPMEISVNKRRNKNSIKNVELSILDKLSNKSKKEKK